MTTAQQLCVHSDNHLCSLSVKGPLPSGFSDCINFQYILE